MRQKRDGGKERGRTALEREKCSAKSTLRTGAAEGEQERSLFLTVLEGGRRGGFFSSGNFRGEEEVEFSGSLRVSVLKKYALVEPPVRLSPIF